MKSDAARRMLVVMLGGVGVLPMQSIGMVLKVQAKTGVMPVNAI